MMLEWALLLLSLCCFLLWCQLKIETEQSWKFLSRRLSRQAQDQRLRCEADYKSYQAEMRRIQGTLNKFYIQAKIAEKFAERANNVASTAAIGVAIVQKSLLTPRIPTAQAEKQAMLANKELKKLFGDEPFDWYSEEQDDLEDSERDVLRKAHEHYNQFGQLNGEEKES